MTATSDPRRRDASREAKTRRLALRDAEAERDTLRASLDSARRDLVARVIESTTDLRGDGSEHVTLLRGADYFDALDGDLDACFDEQGDLDRNAIADFIATSTVGRDYLTKPSGPRRPAFDPVRYAIERQKNGPEYRRREPGTTWQTALDPTRT